jgi:hypothetical protein
MLSIVYPVRAYACSSECNWSGTLPSSSGRDRRKRQIQRVLIAVMLLMGAGVFLWKYGADLTWSPAPSPASEESEE